MEFMNASYKIDKDAVNRVQKILSMVDVKEAWLLKEDDFPKDRGGTSILAGCRIRVELTVGLCDLYDVCSVFGDAVHTENLSGSDWEKKLEGISLIDPVTYMGKNKKEVDQLVEEYTKEGIELYKRLVSLEVPPISARKLLPGSIAIECRVLANILSWHGLLRAGTKSYNLMVRYLSIGILGDFMEYFPGMFEEVLDPN